MDRLYWWEGRWTGQPAPAPCRVTDWMVGGLGVFETILVAAGRVPFVDRHLARAAEGLHRLELPLPQDFERIPRAFGEGIARLSLDRGGARAYFLAGPGGSSCLLELFRDQPWLAAEREAGIAVGIETELRVDPDSPLCGVKTIGRSLYSWIARRAQGRGWRECLILNRRGELVEALSSNLFWVQAGCLVTPHLSCGGLPGITRELVLETAARLGWTVEQGRHAPHALDAAAEVFLSGTLKGILPVVEIAGRPVADRQPGPLTRRLQQQFPR